MAEYSLKTLRQKIVANFPDRVEEVEDAGMDEGRFFVHLKRGWTYRAGNGIQRTKSFDGLMATYRALRDAVPEEEA